MLTNIAVALKETDIMIGEIVVMPNEGTIFLGYTDLGYLPSKDSQVFGKWLRFNTIEEITQAVR